MPFASLLSTDADSERALADVLKRAGSFSSDGVDLAIVFYSPHHQETLAKHVTSLRACLKARVLLGCPGETIIGNEREIEQAPALALWLARWSAPIRMTPFRLTVEQTSEGFSLLGWPDELAEAQGKEGLVLTLADPFTFPIDAFLSRLNKDRPGLAVVGGMASGADQPDQTLLLYGEEAVAGGAVSVFLQGPLGYRSVVSQGCRPLGKPLVITKARDNIIFELGGKPALEQLQTLWDAAAPREQELIRRGLHVGRVISEYQDSFQRGDFLVRNVMGLDRANGGLVVAERVRPGQTIQFHVRDAQTADEDLRLMLQSAGHGHTTPPAGGLLFSCNGRGTRLFETPHHDAQTTQEALGGFPLAGFFAQGELGPIGGQNFIHGFTASLVLFDDVV